MQIYNIHTMTCYSHKEKLCHEICRWINGSRKHFIACELRPRETNSTCFPPVWALSSNSSDVRIWPEVTEETREVKRGHMGLERALEMGVGEYRWYGGGNGENLGL